MPLSARQMEYLALAWQCFEGPEPKIDYEKFAKDADLASPNSARELMRVTKKKLAEEYGVLSCSVKAKKTPRGGTTTTPPKKRAAEGEDDVEETPVPKSGGGRKRAKKGDEGVKSAVKKKGAVKKEELDEEEGGADAEGESEFLFN